MYDPLAINRQRPWSGCEHCWWQFKGFFFPRGNRSGFRDGQASIWTRDPKIQLVLQPCVTRHEPWRRVQTIFAYLLPCSFQQDEIVRIRLLDRRDSFAGESFSESGAKGKLCHASAPYASYAASVPVTGPFARGRSSRHGRVKSAIWRAERAHYKAARGQLGLNKEPSPYWESTFCWLLHSFARRSFWVFASLTLPVSHFEGKGHFEQDLSGLVFFHPLSVNLGFGLFVFSSSHLVFLFLPEDNVIEVIHCITA